MLLLRLLCLSRCQGYIVSVDTPSIQHGPSSAAPVRVGCYCPVDPRAWHTRFAACQAICKPRSVGHADCKEVSQYLEKRWLSGGPFE